MAKLLSRSALMGALLLAACSEGTGPGDAGTPADSLTALPRALTAVEQEGIQANNRFALHLLRTTASTRTGNVLLSPLSVSFALGMTMNGASGETLSEMNRTLGWGTRTRAETNAAYRDLRTMLPSLDKSTTIRIANGLWVRRPMVIDTGFLREARTFFDAPAQSLATPQIMYDSVNVWGNRHTDGMIPRVLQDEPPADLAMLLANAVYFSGTWRDKFDPAKTASMPFMLSSGAQISHPMMQREGGFSAFQNQNLMAAEMLYGNGAYSMVVVAPATGTATALAARLDSAEYATIVRGLRQADNRSMIFLPRFKVQGILELAPDLQNMGMPRAFTAAAEFPRLVNEPTKLKFVRHAVALEVDERGSRAAAVTVVGAVVVSMPPSYQFNRPFVFFIRERLSGTILFAGVVNDPRQ
ncbi:MAG TPA: serpin family protein [Gemmatimonas sp.]|uniref:serpin family protein n=1 Tax=Gemmatimonas sp. TaxID=1962908 RepID=UPI002ED7BBE4